MNRYTPSISVLIASAVVLAGCMAMPQVDNNEPIIDPYNDQGPLIRQEYINAGFDSKFIEEVETGAPFCAVCPKPDYKLQLEVGYDALRAIVLRAASDNGLELREESFPSLIFDWVVSTKSRFLIFIDIYPDQDSSKSWIAISQINEKRVNESFPWKKVEGEDLSTVRKILRVLRQEIR